MGETIPPASTNPRADQRVADGHESATTLPPAASSEANDPAESPGPAPASQREPPLQAAADAASRAGSRLSELSRRVACLSTGLSSAKQVSEQLVQELTTLRVMLGAPREEQLALEERVAELEQALVAARTDAERERRFLTDQHDHFLATLLAEHEEALAARASDERTARMSAELADLARKLLEAESERARAERDCERAREALARAQGQRDEAQTRAEKRERERDELRFEASQLRARLGESRPPSTAPPPAAARPSSTRPPPRLSLDTNELDSALHGPPHPPRLPPSVPRFVPLRADPALATTAPPPAGPAPFAPDAAGHAGDVSAPTAEPFPRESTRPGVGGPRPSRALPPPSFGPSPSPGSSPIPPPAEAGPTKPAPRPVASAASLHPDLTAQLPALKQKPDPTTRPLFDYSLGEGGVLGETLEGARLSSKPPRK
jgi:hypothetical protein